MKVVLASHEFLPSIGGVSTTVSILAKAFVSLGHEVVVVTPAEGPTEGYGYTVVRKPSPLALFRLYRQAELLILSNLAIKNIYPLVILKRAIALSHHSESAFHLSKSPVSRDVLRRFVFRRATNFMTSEYIGRKSGLQSYAVTPPFANPEHIKAEVVKPAQERGGAVFVGRLEPEKGILYLLDRWGWVAETLGVKKLRIIGGGSLNTEIERRIAEGLVGSVELVGKLGLEETAREMGKATYSIVPSLWEEPFGAVALEFTGGGVCRDPLEPRWAPGGDRQPGLQLQPRRRDKLSLCPAWSPRSGRQASIFARRRSALYDQSRGIHRKVSAGLRGIKHHRGDDWPPESEEL